MGWTTFDSAGAALERSFSDTPIGTMTGYAGSSAPTGWLQCDGSAISRTVYADLFSVIGTTYGTGNGSTTFNLPASDGDIIYAQSLSERVAAITPPQYVTSLPSNPVDGQTVIYAADASNGVMWTLRYRAAGGTYKWEAIGDSALSNEVTGAVSTSSTTFTDLTGSSGPSITVPLAGTYQVYMESNGYSGTSADNLGFMRVTESSPSTTVMSSGQTYSAYQGDTQQVSQKIVTLSAGTYKMQYSVNRNSVVFRNRVLMIRPVRVG